MSCAALPCDLAALFRLFRPTPKKGRFFSAILFFFAAFCFFLGITSQHNQHSTALHTDEFIPGLKIIFLMGNWKQKIIQLVYV